MGVSPPRPFGRRAAQRYRVRLRVNAGKGFYGGEQVRLLRIYLGATTFLYAYGVAFTLYPVRRGPTLSNPTGGLIAIGLGLAALAWLAVRSDKTAPATAVAIAATPIVMAFHHTITAEFVCLLAPIFLATYLRAFYSPRRGAALVALLTAACLLALGIAPASKLVIDYLIFAIAIVGAAESFGLLTRALVNAACTDPLTHLLNRAGWEIATADLLARSRSESVTVTVMVLDIDNLKTINDTHGHLAGDQHLVSHADCWRILAPANAVLARLGGDEFAVCMASDAARASGDSEQFVADVRLHTPATSIGTASHRGANADIATLYATADAEMYEAKRRKLSDAPNADLRRDALGI